MEISDADVDRDHRDLMQADMERQATLERLGWKFVRVRGTHFFRDPDDAMRGVFEALEKEGVAREAEAEDELEEPASDLTEAIIRRADEIRRAWRGEAGAEYEQDGEEPADHEVAGSGEPVGGCRRRYGHILERSA